MIADLTGSVEELGLPRGIGRSGKLDGAQRSLDADDLDGCDMLASFIDQVRA